MANDSLKGAGTTIWVSISAVYTKIPKATEITPAGLAQDVYEYTELESTGKRRAGSSIMDGGQVTFKVNSKHADTTHQFLLAQLVNPDPVPFKVVYSDAEEDVFDAVVSGFAKDPITPLEGVKGTFTLDVDGLVTTPTP